MAQLPVSRSAAVVTSTIKGNGKNGFVGLPYTKEPVAREVVVSGSNVLTLSGSYSASSLSTPPHAVMILTGSNRGQVRRITANSGSNVTLESAISGLTSSDELYLVPEWTVGNLFGTVALSGTLPSGIKGSNSELTADIVFIANASGNLVQLFFNTSLGFWTTVGGATDQQNARLGGLNGGCMIKRAPGTSDLTFLHQGVTRTGRQIAALAAGSATGRFMFLTNPNTVSTTLLNSAILTNAITGGSTTTADVLYYANASGNLIQVYYDTTASQWRTVGGVSDVGSSATTTIRPNTSLLVRKRNTSATAWTVNENFVP